MINKKNIPLIIALAIPVLMIILVAAFIYMPGFGKKPQYNFLYLTGNNVYPYGGQQFVVSAGHLVQTLPQTPPPNAPSYTTYVDPIHFYLYDVSSGTATEVSFARAQTYALDPSNTSADGYIIQQGSSDGGGLLFGGTPVDYNSWFIQGHNRSIKLNLKLTGTYYNNFQFLGWVN